MDASHGHANFDGRGGDVITFADEGRSCCETMRTLRTLVASALPVMSNLKHHGFVASREGRSKRSKQDP